MARKGRRAPPKRAAATATEPSPAPDVDGDNSATAPLETAATSPADQGQSQLSIEPKHEDLGADDDEKMASLSDDPSRARSMADDDALTKEANGAGVSEGLSSDQPTQAPWQAGSSEISHFPAGFSLPPIPSTSSAVQPARTDYTPEEIAAWRERQIDAKQAEVRCGHSSLPFLRTETEQSPATAHGRRRQARRLRSRALPSGPLRNAHRV